MTGAACATSCARPVWADAAAGFGLAAQDLAGVVRAAPSMRPERHTVLSEPGITDTEVAAAVADVLGAGSA